MAFIKTSAPKTLTFDEAVKLVKPLRLKEPSPRVARELSELKKLRRVNLDFLEPINKMCCWCEEKKLPKARRKYCSDSCRDSAFAYCNPHLDHIKGHILIFNQSCACVGCGLSFENTVRRHIEVSLNGRIEYNSLLLGREKPQPLTDFNPAVAVDNTGHLMQVDHIIPIHHGGGGLGWHNLQVLCTDCHKQKTINERKRSK